MVEATRGKGKVVRKELGGPVSKPSLRGTSSLYFILLCESLKGFKQANSTLDLHFEKIILAASGQWVI